MLGVMSIKIALEEKSKLGFVDATCQANDLEQWNRVYYMVTSQILNSISKDIVKTFLYASSLSQLRAGIQGRYGEVDGPLIYQLNRKINSMSLGSMTMTKYYTKLKIFLDEL